LDHQLLARAALSFLCAVQAIATVAIDFNRTHTTNPLWTGHARFHVVWQGSTVVFISALELVLIWHSGPLAGGRFRLAALLAALSPAGFLTAFTTRKLFGGSLSDANGIPPLRLRFFETTYVIDLNLVAVVVALISLLALIALYRG
jgi:hypothetical protein